MTTTAQSEIRPRSSLLLRVVTAAYRKGFLPPRGTGQLFDRTPVSWWGGKDVFAKTKVGVMTLPLSDQAEANPHLIPYLRRNVSGRVEVLNAAISGESGELTFYISDYCATNAGELKSLKGGLAALRRTPQVNVIVVPAQRHEDVADLVT